jgi:cytochrome c oxidase cbb3-type subunit 2
MNLPPLNLSFPKFFGLIFAIFMFTWFGLVVFPWIALGHLAPIQEEDSTNITPWDSPGAAHQGELVYASLGCVYCHTQQVRAATSGADIIRGWGTATDDTDDKKEITRRTFPRDYIWQHQVFLGNSRSGADLANVAHRFPTAAQLYRYLYDPYILNGHSSMPAYKFLFVEQKIRDLPSNDALVLDPADAPPAGWEIVPTADAKSLVAYLLSLNKGYHLPDENGPVAPQTPSKS